MKCEAKQEDEQSTSEYNRKKSTDSYEKCTVAGCKSVVKRLVDHVKLGITYNCVWKVSPVSTLVPFTLGDAPILDYETKRNQGYKFA